MIYKVILGVASVAAGAILALFFWDQEVFWFQGGPLGLVLIAIGGWDLVGLRTALPSRQDARKVDHSDRP